MEYCFGHKFRLESLLLCRKSRTEMGGFQLTASVQAVLFSIPLLKTGRNQLYGTLTSREMDGSQGSINQMSTSFDLELIRVQPHIIPLNGQI